MKKKILTLAAVATLALMMTACGTAQTSNTPTPTVEPTKEVEATTVPTVEPTATSAPEPTATSAPTPTPTPIPYAEEKGIVIENKTEFESSFIHYVRSWESEEETTFPGLTTKNEECKLVVDSVTQEAADEEGYTTFTVQYHLDCVVKQSVDIREGDTCGCIVWLLPAFSICDYYTGLSGINNLVEGGISGSGETVLNWNGEEIKISFSLDNEFEWSLGEWRQESDNIYTMLCPARQDHTMVITVPDGYDGIMLKVEKKGFVGQGKAAVEEIIKKSGGSGVMLSEDEKADEFHFIRLTDVAEKIAEAEPTEVPTEAPVAGTKDFETVLRELHALRSDEDYSGFYVDHSNSYSYEEREAYIKTLDPTRYEVVAEDNFAAFNLASDGGGYYEQVFMWMTGSSYFGEFYVMGLKDLTTGEIDPWGIVLYGEDFKNGGDKAYTYTFEYFIEEFNYCALDAAETDDPTFYTITCPVCLGDMQYGEGICETCDGIGGFATDKICSDCDGVNPDECWECRGTGKELDYCDDCYGRGTNSCSQCNGSGLYNPYKVIPGWDTYHYYEDSYTIPTSY